MKSMRFLSLGLGMTGALCLSACADPAKGPDFGQTPAAVLTPMPNGGTMIYDSASMMAPPGAAMPAPVTPVTDMPLPDAATSPASSDSSVEVYSLDNSALGTPPMSLTSPMAAPVPGAFQADMSPPPPVGTGLVPSPQGNFYGGNQNVEVFPLDGPAPQSSMKSDMPFNTVASSRGSSRGAWVEAAGMADRLYFKNGSAMFAADDDVIAKVAGEAGTHTLVRVEGHASRHTVLKNRREAHIVNLAIAMQRAVNVSKALIRHGVPARNIKTTAWGDTHPPSEAGDRDADAAARRVEIYLQTR